MLLDVSEIGNVLHFLMDLGRVPRNMFWIYGCRGKVAIKDIYRTVELKVGYDYNSRT